MFELGVQEVRRIEKEIKKVSRELFIRHKTRREGWGEREREKEREREREREREADRQTGRDR